MQTITTRSARELAVERLRAGETLFRTTVRSGFVYELHPSGTVISPAVGRELIGSGLLEGCGDSLFFNMSQSFRWKRTIGVEL
ncbi:MAG: hypothetical protein EOS85_11585 [Mesorhizobium sp.]|nr:MAG: hypothetical protein EOS85_11585 [Mesorhizobium sp.]